LGNFYFLRFTTQKLLLSRKILQNRDGKYENTPNRGPDAL